MTTGRRPGVPAYLKHKASGQAFTVIRAEDGKRRQVYLGPYDSPESQRKYREILARHLDPSREPVPAMESRQRVTVADLVARFLAWAEGYYRTPDGTPTSEHPNFVVAAGFLLKLYRDESVEEFGPLKLKRVRELMVEEGWARKTVNRQAGRLKRLYKWGVENELVPGEVFLRLQAVAGLRRGRTTARETAPVVPVTWAAVQAVLPHVSRQVTAMILLQWHSGMRPAEVVKMRTGEVDRSGTVWVYRPAEHKTAYRGREREVYLGPESQKVLAPFLKADPQAFIFEPCEAEKERRAEQRRDRKTPLWPSHLEAQARKRKVDPEWEAGERYSVASYRRAIQRACDAAKVEQWSPNRLRHARATEVRKRFGLEAAQVTLGHASADITQVYAERDRELAKKVALETG